MHLAILVLLLLALVFGPGLWVQHVMRRYSEPADRYPGTGAELVRHLAGELDLPGLRVEQTELGDHYDPEEKVVRLTPDKYNGRSLTAITVAAHEVGHALQDREGYGPLRWRSRLVKSMRGAERLGAALLMASPFLGLLTRAPSAGLLLFAGGLLTLGSSTLVHLVTLPTEFDASFGRALPVLERANILKRVDRPHARRLLTAAAFTYVAASLMSLLNIARWWALIRR
ncbi:MAG: zinc metallopeptidase [Halofilum sp. (in: g-proteobacteria)]|nr:zinc metallopeptidase [Halofilum sp. (in: g-proteobacteria)]